MPDVIRSTGITVPMTEEMWSDSEVWRNAQERCMDGLEQMLTESVSAVCFAHRQREAVAQVFVGDYGRLHWLPVCRTCAMTHDRAGHQLAPV